MNDHPGLSSTYSLAGAMIRAPKTIVDAPNDWMPGEENYVFLSVGFGAVNHPSCNACSPPHLEVKSTINSNSSLSISEVDTNTVTIRIARIGNDIIG